MFIKNDPEYNTDHNAGWTIGGFTQRWFWLLSPHGRSSGLLLSEMELGKYIGDTEIWIYYIYIYNCNVSWCLIIHHLASLKYLHQFEKIIKYTWWLFFQNGAVSSSYKWLFNGKFGSHNPPGKLSGLWAPYKFTSEDQSKGWAIPPSIQKAWNSKKTDPKPKYVFVHVIVGAFQPFRSRGLYQSNRHTL